MMAKYCINTVRCFVLPGWTSKTENGFESSTPVESTVWPYSSDKHTSFGANHDKNNR